MKRLLVMLCYLVFAGCAHEKTSVQQITGTNLTVQVNNLPGETEKAEISYQVKLIPDRDLIEKFNTKQKDEIWYRADSCFYITDGGEKITPDLVQPIANGQSGNYEFLLSFSAGSGMSDSATLVYKDKFFNKETYNFKVNLKN